LLYRSIQKPVLALVLAGVAFTCAGAQTQKPSQPPQPQPDTLTVKSARRQTPQVVTIVHRVNGIKAVVLMRRNGEMVATVDDKLVTSGDAVTSITAGFVLGDGESVVARLSQAEAEAEAQGYTPAASSFAWSYQTPPSPKIWDVHTPPASRAEFVVVEASGKQLAARYVGLDGGSGLSLLKIPGLNTTLSRDASEERLAIGQRVRLFAPVRIGATLNKEPGTVSVSVGEIEGKITEITRTSTGKIANLTIKAQNLSPMIVGGVALNDAGETIGIVETSDAAKARLIPAAAVRRAAGRVFSRQASVPRPWLGVRGEAVAATSLERFSSIGWTEQEVAKLKESYQGLLLTAVAPGTPAALADLRPGDVIVRVNDRDVKSPEDFSFFLNEAGGGATVNFTFFRGQTPQPNTLFTPAMPPPMALPAPPSPIAPKAFPSLKPLEVSVKMGEALNPARSMRLAESYAMGVQSLNRLPPITRGLETVALSPKAAAHLGARGGVLVVFVEPESAAARAGVRVFDVIESVEGKPLGRASWTASLPAGDPQRLLLGIVREREKVEIKIEQTNAPKK
jgi:S1-C subfamily serine protease